MIWTVLFFILHVCVDFILMHVQGKRIYHQYTMFSSLFSLKFSEILKSTEICQRAAFC